MASELTPKLVTCQVPNLHKQKRLGTHPGGKGGNSWEQI